ncbi:MAG TPA: cyclophilin-like fold protein [Intrasporangium sp.]|uniref:cyclophilin-like fold protein n=1 Tax=Intrasporangium sp. TaxID=1925024 RepID=UPI002D776F4D|nr:cyclophilin-like fold protein [Intrasporangium sp.]HET7397810.1 cyclophilin-like fold protein [Intrasporangium sp.]
MNLAVPLGSRLRAAAALVPATLAVMLACWSPGGRVDPPVPAEQASATTTTAPNHAGASGLVLLRVPDGTATVTLDDTPAAQAFAAQLPLRLTLRDPMGQAKSGQLPSSIDVTGARPVFHPRVGELYYWAPSHSVAIFCDDLGQSVPPPGLVRLGVVESGLASIGTAGNRFPVQIGAG